MVIDEYIAAIDKNLNTHNWEERRYIQSHVDGKPFMQHPVDQCKDCHEYKSYNRSHIQPCAMTKLAESQLSVFKS